MEYFLPFNQVKHVFNILNRLGSGKLHNFRERLRTQKIHYLAQEFGVSPVYCYNLYLRGPYSPQLAHDIFRLKESKVSAPRYRFVANELENRFQRLKDFIKVFV